MFGLTPFSRNQCTGFGKARVPVINNLFEDFFNDAFTSVFGQQLNPIKADAKENEKEYIIKADIPGVRKEDIKLDLNNDVLTVAVEQNQEISEEKENYIRRERKYGSFARSFYVENIDEKGITAKYQDGVLTVVLPKSGEKKEKQNGIEIQ